MPPFDWREYLAVAHFLVNTPGNFSQEAAFRCATSRAYYAAFCYARNYARFHHGFVPTGTEADHLGVRDHFERRGMGHISDKLDQLRQWRNRCDYVDEVFQLSRNTAQALTEAQRVLDRLVPGNP